MRRHNTLFTLFLIFILAFFLRTYRLTDFPPSLNWDEVSHAYNSFSLLFTGHDQWGSLPLFNFRAYGDYPTPLNILLTVPFIGILGANDFAVRLPHALIGSLMVPITFLIAYSLSQKRTLSILASLFVSLDPWLLFPSRAIFQSNWTVFLTSLGLLYYLRKSPPWSIFFFALSLFSYHNARIFVPLLVIPLLYIYRRHLKVWLIFLIFFVPVLFQLFTPEARARSSWVGIIDSGAISGIEQARNASSLPSLANRLVNNRYSYFLRITVRNYLGYFSPRYLFQSGGTQYQFSLPGFGLLPTIYLPFFYIGIYLLYAKKHKFLIYWLLLAPLPASVTRDQFAVIRSTTMLPVVQLATAFGVSWAIAVFKKFKLSSIFFVIFSLALLSFMERYLISYVTSYPTNYSSSWQYGYRQVIDYISEHQKDYSQIIFTKKYGEPHEFVLWYTRYSPQKYQSSQIGWDYHDHWYWVNGFADYKFVNDWEMTGYLAGLPAGKYLVIASPGASLPGQDISTINFLNGQPAFIINSYEK